MRLHTKDRDSGRRRAARANPEHVLGDDEIAFRDLHRIRCPDLSKQQFRDLFEEWRDRYFARLSSLALPPPARKVTHRTGRADLRHPALRLASSYRRSARPVLYSRS